MMNITVVRMVLFSMLKLILIICSIASVAGVVYVVYRMIRYRKEMGLHVLSLLLAVLCTGICSVALPEILKW